MHLDMIAKLLLLSYLTPIILGHSIAHSLQGGFAQGTVQYHTFSAPITFFTPNSTCNPVDIHQHTVVVPIECLSSDLLDDLARHGASGLIINLDLEDPSKESQDEQGKGELLKTWKEREGELLARDLPFPVVMASGIHDTPTSKNYFEEYAALVTPKKKILTTIKSGKRINSIINVIGTLRGTRRGEPAGESEDGVKDAYVILCHWDAFAAAPNLAHGATAAASAALLIDMARKLSYIYKGDASPNASLIFVLASGNKELGYAGARAWAREYMQENMPVKGILVLESLLDSGFPNNGGANTKRAMYIRGNKANLPTVFHDSLVNAAKYNDFEVLYTPDDDDPKEREHAAVSYELGKRTKNGKKAAYDDIPILGISLREVEDPIQDTVLDKLSNLNDSCNDLLIFSDMATQFMMQLLLPNVDLYARSNRLLKTLEMERQVGHEYLFSWLKALSNGTRMIPYARITREKSSTKRSTPTGQFSLQGDADDDANEYVMESYIDSLGRWLDIQYQSFQVKEYLNSEIKYDAHIQIELDLVLAKSALFQAMAFFGAIGYVLAIYFVLSWRTSGYKIKVF